MDVLENYIEGVVRIPLLQFVSEDDNRYASDGIVTSGFEGLLQNPKCQIIGYITSKVQSSLLQALKFSASEFKSTINSATIPSIAGQEIYCLANTHVLEATKKLYALDESFECTVRICCLPPPQFRKFSDGEIFQNVRLFAKQKRYDIAQRWANILSPPKRRHLNFMFDRPDIMDALDRLLCFPGLWAGLQLGNWAKHLAAHIDDLILNYLTYVSRSYENIFRGHEELKHLLDGTTVLQLQNRAPLWCINDRSYIQEAFRQRIIFPNIDSREVRAKLEHNILSFQGVIPSIQTFHQNMKYITIGAKILEKYIEVKPAAIPRRDITKRKPSLIDNLKKDWIATKATIQIDHEEFITTSETSAELSFMQLLIAALRYFPLLSAEATLQDFDGEWEAPSVDGDYCKFLCQTALRLGFDNEKVRKNAPYVNIDHQRYKKPFARIQWRSGKPPFYSFMLLFHQSFAPQLLGRPFEPSTVAGPLRIQSSILRAFFGLEDYLIFPVALDLVDTDMDDVEEAVQEENSNSTGLSARQRKKVQHAKKGYKVQKVRKAQNVRKVLQKAQKAQKAQTAQTAQMAQTSQEPQSRQNGVDEAALPTANNRRIRPLELDDDVEDIAINPRNKSSQLPPPKRVKHTRAPIQEVTEPIQITAMEVDQNETAPEAEFTEITSREGSPDFPLIRTARIEPLEDDEGEIT